MRRIKSRLDFEVSTARRMGCFEMIVLRYPSRIMDLLMCSSLTRVHAAYCRMLCMSVDSDGSVIRESVKMSDGPKDGLNISQWHVDAIYHDVTGYRCG